MKPTKQHIQDHALKLFNEKGFVNVRLQHIADSAFVSVGHLAYHFKNKEAIIESLYDELKAKQGLLLAEFRVVPLFEDINRYLISTYHQQSEYIFFYVDTIEIVRAYPQIQKKYSQHILWQLAQLKLMLGFNIARGSLIPLADQQVDHLSWQLRSIIDLWRYIVKTEGTKSETEQTFLNDIWGVLTPLFTDMGNREYRQLHLKG